MASIRDFGHRARAAAADAVGPRGRAMYRRVKPRRPLRTPAAPVAPRVPPATHLGPGGQGHLGAPPGAAPPRFLWPSYPPSAYLGQLDDAFQATLAAERAYLTQADCDFYHTSELTDGSIERGPWDLRGHEHEYLGGTEVGGARVLELGPATGHLTFWMEAQGADVVAFDVGYDRMIDLLPRNCLDARALAMDHVALVGSVQNSWWYLHRDRHSRARKVYGDIYALPGDLGPFDISVFGAILLHLRDPFSALEQAARRTRDAIVVTEPLDPSLPAEPDACRFDPTGRPDNWTVWWSFNPGSIQKMLGMLGFGRTTVTTHRQRLHRDHRMDEEASDYPMFTVVGRRP